MGKNRNSNSNSIPFAPLGGSGSSSPSNFSGSSSSKDPKDEIQEALEKFFEKNYKNQIDGLKKNLSDLKEENDNLKKDLSDLKEEVSTLKTSYDKKTKEYDNLKKDFEAHKKENEDLKASVDKYTEEFKKLSIGLSDYDIAHPKPRTYSMFYFATIKNGAENIFSPNPDNPKNEATIKLVSDLKQYVKDVADRSEPSVDHRVFLDWCWIDPLTLEAQEPLTYEEKVNCGLVNNRATTTTTTS